MSATITLKQTMARGSDAVLKFLQYSLMIAGFLLILGILGVFTQGTASVEILKSAWSQIATPDESQEVATETEAAASVLSPGMQGALDYVTRRYRVSPEALEPVFEVAQLIGKERRIDPLLIVAIIGIESGFNPFAESPMGAQGLMQVIPRFHMDKVPDGSGDKPFLDPEVNIRVGVHILEEAIHRRGGLVAGLQYYAGSSEPEGSYASKVLAEKARLTQAARRNTRSNA
ncbi:transglycosylase SLT domain-containing protein [Propionivibrio sp.]|uniref:transglycosylase SLT domain-containing protein n=1 Tax=Propionivibrio sp. TaxID=2212460 RepID=UPI0025E9026B|nr:transglycosylase SLT domain-containing protein [Propionivibrio sp.]MBK7355415.1 transglycosylase SLT domain-containing protein [Propionivibrio sp.]MBK8399821.1 transglycosylase SLT domain-containing protein [Propionivibrio sp.]MBK8743290.1 transglycosylase SLT domain-containing protein [Propionivibrio sp.]MBK8894695.1 transglycosylase SLT domain-containing protein [Propionivibrio sp.]